MQAVAQVLPMEDLFEAVVELTKEKIEKYKEEFIGGLVKAFTQVVGKAAFEKILDACFSIVKSKNNDKVFVLIKGKLEDLKVWVDKNRKFIVFAVSSIVSDRLANWFVKHSGVQDFSNLGVGVNVAVAAIASSLSLSTVAVGAAESMIVTAVLPVVPVIAVGAAVGFTLGLGVAKLSGKGKSQSPEFNKFQGEVIPLL